MNNPVDGESRRLALRPAETSRGKSARQRQRGAIGGLSDTALAVVVGTLALVGVVGFFSTSSQGAKMNTDIANFTALINNTNVIAYNAAPQALIRNASLQSAVGGAITITTVSASSFSVAYAALPQDACFRYITTLSKVLADQLVSVTINGNAAITTMPVAIGTAQTECVAGTANSITWTF
jgi:hypothetical protein